MPAEVETDLNALGHQRMSLSSNMMRDIADGLCNFALCSLPFWIVLMTLYFAAFRVNCFFRLFPAPGGVLNPFGKLPPIYYFINNLQEEIEIGISSSGA
jgi:hypothetical protein